MMRNGWNVDVDFSNGDDPKYLKDFKDEECKDSDTFYGYKEGNRVGSVSAIFKGSGKGTLKYGDCSDSYRETFSTVWLNDVQIDETVTPDGSVHFQYNAGDFLEIKEHHDAILKIFSLDVQDGSKYFK